MWEQRRANETGSGLAAARAELAGMQEWLDTQCIPDGADLRGRLVRARAELERVVAWNMRIPVVVMGAGMFTQQVVGPSLLHEKRVRNVGPIHIVNRSAKTLSDLTGDPTINSDFPDVTFDDTWAAETQCPGEDQDEACMRQIASNGPGCLAMIVTPDPSHHKYIMNSLRNGQNVGCVKPLVLTEAQRAEIEETAYNAGLLVLVEHHKLEDTRHDMARIKYQEGAFGEFRCGFATMIEDSSYRRSNFGKWYENAFVYVGGHYTGMTHFITGLKAVEVTVHRGPEMTFPGGEKRTEWTSAVIKYENGAILTVTNGLGCPEQGAGNNHQGLTLMCQNGAVYHNDFYRGIEHVYDTNWAETKSRPHRYPSDGFWQLVDWEGPGKRPLGYGYRSMDNIIQAARTIEAISVGLEGNERLRARQIFLDRVRENPLLASPGGSMIREEALINEAAAVSFETGQTVRIPGRKFRGEV